MFPPLIAHRIANAPYLHVEKDNVDFFVEMNRLNRYEISNKPWPEFSTACSASFAIAHTRSSILLKYFIKDDFFSSIEREINADVNKDNCVEFFIGFADDAYYNIEFNCLGVGKVGYGRSRSDRKLLPVAVIEKIAVDKNLTHKKDGFDWEILLTIPKDVFIYDDINLFTGLICKANFYKCGDDLPNKDFLVWNQIINNEPDFHKPEFFGEIVFE